ncbi:MAG: hypothetical protein J2P38_05740 [Candidatus Dormibacteraeota bacterium]|nr:hypothetical protein [Candidatus Dormibacteraeota bacterium]
MPEWAPVLLVLLVGVVGLTLLWRLGAWTPASVQTFRRLATRDGITLQTPLAERVLRRAPGLRRLQDATDVSRLLLLAGRPGSAAAWTLRQVGFAVLTTAVLLVLDAATLASEGRLALPPYLAFVFGLTWWLLGWVRLRNAAQRRRDRLERAVQQSFVELALLTSTRQLPVAVAFEEVVARSQSDQALFELFRGDAWRPLVEAATARAGGAPQASAVGPSLRSTAEVYTAIGDTYGVPSLALLGTNLHRINDMGQAPAEVLTALARTAADDQVATMLIRTEQARVRQAIPVGLMVLPLLALVGFPLIISLQSLFT